MTADHYHPWLHRMAVLTACLVLLPIVVGALVTTLGAGMAFLDWPTSDGQNMLLYPILRDIADGKTDKVVEHGHRLAGALIGLVSIALVVATHLTERRRWVVGMAWSVLLAVIVQGLLGGARVIQNENVLALVHGGSAALVFSLMGCFALVTGRAWLTNESPDLRTPVEALRPLSVLTPLVLLIQYLIGGHVRHLGTMLHGHLWIAALASCCVIATVVASFRTESWHLRRSAGALAGLLLAQLALGIGAWITRFGLASVGFVAVQQSLPQVLFRTAHAVVGATLLMAAVVHAVRVFRWTVARNVEASTIMPRPLASTPTLGEHAG